MAAFIADAVFDAALNFLETNGTVLHITKIAVTAWANIAANTLGNKTACTYTGPADGTSGRKTVLDAITGGSVTATETASHFAITNGSNAVYIAQELNATQAVTSGNAFTLTEITVQLSDPIA